MNLLESFKGSKAEQYATVAFVAARRSSRSAAENPDDEILPFNLHDIPRSWGWKVSSRAEKDEFILRVKPVLPYITWNKFPVLTSLIESQIVDKQPSAIMDEIAYQIGVSKNLLERPLALRISQGLEYAEKPLLLLQTGGTIEGTIDVRGHFIANRFTQAGVQSEAVIKTEQGNNVTFTLPANSQDKLYILPKRNRFDSLEPTRYAWAKSFLNEEQSAQLVSALELFGNPIIEQQTDVAGAYYIPSFNKSILAEVAMRNTYVLQEQQGNIIDDGNVDIRRHSLPQ